MTSAETLRIMNQKMCRNQGVAFILALLFFAILDNGPLAIIRLALWGPIIVAVYTLFIGAGFSVYMRSNAPSPKQKHLEDQATFAIGLSSSSLAALLFLFFILPEQSLLFAGVLGLITIASVLVIAAFAQRAAERHESFRLLCLMALPLGCSILAWHVIRFVGEEKKRA